MANTNDDVLTLDWSGYAEGYGFNTYSFQADATGGWKGYYYLDGATRLDFTSIERFNITGTDYADSIQTGDRADVIDAGGGNDVVYSGLGKDTLDGGSGIDGISRNLIDANAAISINLRDNTVTAAYGTITGFEYFKDFTGTTRNDVFVSSNFRGDDNVNGGEGNDRAEFVRGSDNFTGGGDIDTLKVDFSWSDTGSGVYTNFYSEASGEGFSGGFYFYAGGPNRATFNTTENFEAIGTKYNDAITTGAGNDILSGGAGNDDLRSGGGTDALDGGEGIDGVGRDFSLLNVGVAIDLGAGTLTGTAGSIVNFEYFSQITGGNGNDVFVSTNAFANDRVNGDDGDDTASFFNGYDTFAGGLGVDRVIYDFSASMRGSGITTYLTTDSSGGYSGYLYLADSSMRVDFSSTEAFTITGTGFADSITTGDGNDTIAGGDGYDVIRSGGGDDVLSGGAGLDGLGRTLSSLTTAVGINLLQNSISGIGGSISGFEYFADVKTGTGADRLVSGRLQLNDSVDTGGGNDIFTTYAGWDSFTAGQGNDKLVIDWSQLRFGYGINNVYQVADTSADGWRGYFIAQTSEQARVDYSSVETFDITGTVYDDQIQTRNGDDVLKGLAGNDRLNAGGGSDIIDGGDGIDGFAKDFTGANKAITVDLTTNTITNTGTTIANVEYLLDVRTGSGADKFVTLGLQANDVAWGGGGNDIAYFFAGADVFNGGSAKDKLFVDYSALDTDTGMSSYVTVDSTNGGFSGYYFVDGSNRSDFTGVESVDVTGTKNNDGLNGTGGADTFRGGDGRDTLNGGGGNDVLEGGAAGDVLDGGDGADTLTGGKGSDTLTGGTGADTFVFAGGDTGTGTVYVDRIADFNRTTDGDRIDLSAIDANTDVARNQAFTFIGTNAFTAAGQVRLVTIGSYLYVQGNTNADLGADFSFRVDGETPIGTDFVL